jgi:predicted regulator of Ras-like GTPase activity (Roadblock/LC7/MglB family)
MSDQRAITVSKERIQELDRLLTDFCSQANTVWAIFATNSGQLLVQRGFVHQFDVLAISALACGIFNSTMELARIVGEKKFNEFMQEGRKFSVYYIGVDRDYLLVSLFDDRTIPGVVKIASEIFSESVEKILGNGS